MLIQWGGGQPIRLADAIQVVAFGIRLERLSLQKVPAVDHDQAVRPRPAQLRTFQVGEPGPRGVGLLAPVIPERRADEITHDNIIFRAIALEKEICPSFRCSQLEP